MTDAQLVAFKTKYEITNNEWRAVPDSVFKAIVSSRQIVDRHHAVLVAIQKHIVKCARRDDDIEHYPAEWNVIKKQLSEVIGAMD